MMLKVVVVTNMPAHYQVDLFNEIHRRNNIDIEVVYLRKMSYGRRWNIQQNIEHPHVFLPEIRLWKHWYLNSGALSYFKKCRADGAVIGQYAAVSYQIAMRAFAGNGIPFVFWSEPVSGVEYEPNPLLPAKWMRETARKSALSIVRKHATGLWAIGEMAKKSFRQYFPASIPIDIFPYTSDLSKYFDVDLHKDATDMKFLFSGNLIYRKGFDLVVDAVKLLLKRGETDFSVTVIGAGDQRDLVDEETADVFDFKGFVQHQEVLEYYRRAHVTLFPSRYDGWGMSVVESMAAGRPVISTRKSGAAVDLIQSGVNGFVIQDLSSEALADAMAWFLRNKNEIERMAVQARQTAVNYDVECGAARFEELAEKYFSSLALFSL